MFVSFKNNDIYTHIKKDDKIIKYKLELEIEDIVELMEIIRDYETINLNLNLYSLEEIKKKNFPIDLKYIKNINQISGYYIPISPIFNYLYNKYQTSSDIVTLNDDDLDFLSGFIENPSISSQDINNSIKLIIQKIKITEIEKVYTINELNKYITKPTNINTYSKKLENLKKLINRATINEEILKTLNINLNEPRILK